MEKIEKIINDYLEENNLKKENYKAYAEAEDIAKAMLYMASCFKDADLFWKIKRFIDVRGEGGFGFTTMQQAIDKYWDDFEENKQYQRKI